MGLKFQLEEDNDWGDLSEAKIESIKTGLEDLKAGRVHSHSDVVAHVNQKLNR